MNIEKIRQLEKATKDEYPPRRPNFPRLHNGEMYAALHDLGLRGLEVSGVDCVIVYLPERQRFLIVATDDEDEALVGYDLGFDSLVEAVVTAKVMSSTSVKFSRQLD